MSFLPQRLRRMLNVSSQYQVTSVPVKEIGQKLLWSTGVPEAEQATVGSDANVI